MGDVLHGFMSGTSQTLTPQENVAVMTFIEAENINQAKSNGFKYIMANNTSPLTQQLATNVFGYEVATDIQLNKWTDENGNRPYINAPDTNRIVLVFKKLD